MEGCLITPQGAELEIGTQTYSRLVEVHGQEQFMDLANQVRSDSWRFDPTGMILHTMDHEILVPNITVNFRFAYHTILPIFGAVQQIRENADPGDFYISEGNFHMTILGMIGMDADIAVIAGILKDAFQKPPEVIAWGLNGNRRVISATLVPMFDLYTLRAQLRGVVGDALRYTGVYEHFGWANFWRPVVMPSDLRLQALVRENISTCWGVLRPVAVEVFVNHRRDLQGRGKNLFSMEF